MNPSLIIVINCHYPFLAPGCDEEAAPEEGHFFEALSETYIPLLDMFGRLEHCSIPFRLGVVLTPSICAMLQDRRLLEKYLAWLDRRIAFGKRELERRAGRELSLARYYLDRDVERRMAVTERYGMDLLEAFVPFQKRGRLEFLLSAATHAFLPFYVSIPEAIHAQIETSLLHHRRFLGKIPQGFWLPDLGWSPELGTRLHEYSFDYTIADTHALALGTPSARDASFRPVKTGEGLVVFPRDITAGGDLERLTAAKAGEYQGSSTDAGYELSPGELEPVLNGGGRCSTGYRYRTGKDRLYNPRKARETAAAQAGEFLSLRVSRLQEAQKRLVRRGNGAVSLWAVDAACLGRSWHEGTAFLEALLAEASRREDITLRTPLEYLEQAHSASFQVMEPEFSSALHDGYGGTLLDASNDWIYRHIFIAVRRMTEMTGRFPADSGLKERFLNQAAREILLAQSTDWSKPLNPLWTKGPLGRDYAERELQGTLKNFTAIYEALGSSHISTEWLTTVEKKHSILPHINYRVFGRKK